MSGLPPVANGLRTSRIGSFVPRNGSLGALLFGEASPFSAKARAVFVMLQPQYRIDLDRIAFFDVCFWIDG
jgi:hypothetical protein